MDLQKKIYNFILDFWKLIKKYTPRPKQSEQKVWNELTNEAEKLIQKHNDGSPEWVMFKKMMVVWLDYTGGKYDKET